MHRIPWPRGYTYRNICALYCNYVDQKYGKAAIVFDGYTSTSTKSMTQERCASRKVGATVTITDNMKLAMKDHFLANKSNKQSFINMLSRYLQQVNCQVYHSTENADLLTLNKAVERSRTMDTVLVGDDTDLLNLLCNHADLDLFDLFFQPEPKANSTKCRSWEIKSVNEKLGQEICPHILFIHAISGCDTTSRLYGIGKGLSLKKLVSDTYFREHVKVFDSLPASKEEIV